MPMLISIANFQSDFVWFTFHHSMSNHHPQDGSGMVVIFIKISVRERNPGTQGGL